MNEEDRLRSLVETVRRVRHDANGPLTVALGHVQLLLEDTLRLDPEVQQALAVVEAELRRLIAVLRGLDEVRLDAGSGE
jgi:signal transduction histidine kinase